MSKAVRRQAFWRKESLGSRCARVAIRQVCRQQAISLIELSTPICKTRSKQALLVRSEANPNSMIMFRMIIVMNYKNIMSEQKGEEVNQIKLIAVGDSGVGKTSILTRFTYQKFSDYSEPTLGAAFLTKKHPLSNGKHIEFHIWDTAGQEKYRSIAPIYYREARIALCVYDITSKRSYEVMKKWVQELQANGPKDIVLAVVGNKIDRCDQQEVDYAEVKDYATSLGAILKLVSAKQGKNVEDLFNTVGEMAAKRRGEPVTLGTKVTNKKDKKKKSGCC